MVLAVVAYSTAVGAAMYCRPCVGITHDTTRTVTTGNTAGVAAVEDFGVDNASRNTSVRIIRACYRSVVGTARDGTANSTTHNTTGGVAACHSAAHGEVFDTAADEHTEQTVVVAGGVGHGQVGDAFIVAVEMAAERSA